MNNSCEDVMMGSITREMGSPTGLKHEDTEEAKAHGESSEKPDSPCTFVFYVPSYFSLS
jgi:hypothetical protein